MWCGAMRGGLVSSFSVPAAGITSAGGAVVGAGQVVIGLSRVAVWLPQ